jgi:hypothetical protein
MDGVLTAPLGIAGGRYRENGHDGSKATMDTALREPVMHAAWGYLPQQSFKSRRPSWPAPMSCLPAGEGFLAAVWAANPMRGSHRSDSDRRPRSSNEGKWYLHRRRFLVTWSRGWCRREMTDEGEMVWTHVRSVQP